MGLSEENVITSLETQLEDNKFDVVVGNPPFQSSTHKAKKNSSWKGFLEKSVNISEIVALVLPGSFASPSPTFDNLKSKLRIVSFDVKKHFIGVGSSFCYIILDQEEKDKFTIVNPTESFKVKSNSLDCIPETVTSDLFEKSLDIFKNNRQWKRSCEYHTQNKDVFSENGSIEVIHGAVSKMTNIDHENNSKIRVFCPTTTYPIFRLAHNVGLSQNQVWTECVDLEEANHLIDFLNSDHVQGILRQFKWSNMYYPQTISKLGV